MAGLRDQFDHFYTPDEHDVATALREGLVTSDTNVLLSLYRLQKGAREELFDALERIGERLWVPYQVALEFHRNRLKVIGDQERYFNKSKGELESAIGEYLSKLKAFSARISLPQSDANRLEARIRQAHASVVALVSSAETTNDVHLENRDTDEVLRRLEALLNGRVGEPMKTDELKAAKAEAKKRADDNIPPRVHGQKQIRSFGRLYSLETAYP
jgi:PIN like domain